MEVGSIRESIAEKYEVACKKMNRTANKAIIRQFQVIVQNYLKLQKEKDQEGNNQQLDIVFRGNFKLNFTNRITDSDLMILCGNLSEIPGAYENLRSIDLSYNNISDTSVSELAKIIDKCPNIESLNLQGNNIESNGAAALSEVLKRNISLIYLNLSLNRIKTEGAISIVDILYTNKTLIELNLANNEIDHDGIIRITSILNWNNNTLQILNIDNPYYTSICQETSIHFAKMLQNNTNLSKLSLKKHSLNCEALYTMTEHMLENTCLRVLDLTANKIAFQGCEAIAKYLMGDYCTLESLHLGSNQVKHYGAKALAKAIEKNRSLVHLDLTRNDIDDNGLKMIASALRENYQLVSLKLYWNHFGQMALEEFDSVIKETENERKSDWFLDFYIYWRDDHFEMAMIENQIPYDIYVESQYFYVANENSNVQNE